MRRRIEGIKDFYVLYTYLYICLMFAVGWTAFYSAKDRRTMRHIKRKRNEVEIKKREEEGIELKKRLRRKTCLLLEQ